MNDATKALIDEAKAMTASAIEGAANGRKARWIKAQLDEAGSLLKDAARAYEPPPKAAKRPADKAKR